MRKNKKASIISLEVLIGVVISIMIIVSAVTIISNFYRLSNSSKDSFNQLVALIENVNKDNPGTIKSMPLRMDKGTAIIGFTKDDKYFHFRDKGTELQGGGSANSLFEKPIGNGCETNKACICLCRKLELDSIGGGGYVKCEDKSLICKILEGIEFPNHLPQKNKVYFRKNGFVISRSDFFPTKDYGSQLKEVSVQKYKEFDADDVAVCEILGTDNELYDSCVPLAYKEEKKAMHSLNNFKNFIELCRDREFVEDEKPCSCGAFNFRSFIPEGYTIEFSKSKNGKLNISLKHGTQELGSIEADTGFCIYKLKDDGTGSIDYLNELELGHNINSNYIFYYGDYLGEDSQIAFIKYDKENICLAYHKFSKPPYINPYAEPLDTIWIKDPSGYFGPKKLAGCKYSITKE